jgi:hypothetical protein
MIVLDATHSIAYGHTATAFTFERSNGNIYTGLWCNLQDYGMIYRTPFKYSDMHSFYGGFLLGTILISFLAVHKLFVLAVPPQVQIQIQIPRSKVPLFPRQGQDRPRHRQAEAKSESSGISGQADSITPLNH